MILKWIEKTRKKPKAIRNQYAFVGAVVLTSFIVVIWSLSLPAHFAEVKVDDSVTRESTSALSQFFSQAKENFATVIESAKSNEDSESTTEQSEPEQESPVVMPELSEDNLKTMKENDEALKAPSPRTVLIATTTAGQASTSSQE